MEPSEINQPGGVGNCFLNLKNPASSVTADKKTLSALWQLCSNGPPDVAPAAPEIHLENDANRFPCATANESSPSVIAVLISTVNEMQAHFNTRFDVLERHLASIDRQITALQKLQKVAGGGGGAAAVTPRKRNRTSSPAAEVEHKYFASEGPYTGVGGVGMPLVQQNMHNVENNVQSENVVISVVSACSSKTLSEFMKSAHANNYPSLEGQCVVLDTGYVLSTVVDDHGNRYDWKFPSSLVEKLIRDNPPESTGWSASRALVSLLDYVYHPLELAMRRLPPLPTASPLALNLQGRQKSDLFAGTLYEDGIEFSPERMLPCCKLVEHYYPGWKYKAFERNHAFREMVHKKCRMRRRDLRQYMQQCGKTKEHVLECIIKGVDLPPRQFLFK
ncbi:unnamed protein product [Soboliphyme baturini]|uniref:GCR1_C domain-containing protein n=1 Tax=Soboliphyme baturini TaxID=241478 RepID=A0A183IZF4_9BILA|nr:unnamed protein product [Soboliphyme baturini]